MKNQYAAWLISSWFIRNEELTYDPKGEIAIANLNFESAMSVLDFGKQSVVDRMNIFEGLKLVAHSFISAILSFSEVL